MDLGRQHAQIADELRDAYESVANRGDFILGEAVSGFEDEFGAYVGRECVGISSGTAALTIALRALGIGPGDEVIVPGHTFIASALAVMHVGAEPVLCDVDSGTGLIDESAATDAIGSRTAAIIAVHLYGQSCDMEAIARLSDAHGLALIEDAAQAHGATDRGRRVGSFGDAAAFSFYPSKNLGALGDAGAVCATAPEVVRRARSLRNLGQRRKGEHELAGWNERLSTLQAAFLRVKLQHLDTWNQDRRWVAGRYLEELPAGAEPLSLRAEGEPVFHLFPIRVQGRDSVADYLRAAGIGVGVHYSPALHEQPPLRGLRRTQLPNCSRWSREELSLPIFPGLTAPEIRRVCEQLELALAEASGRSEGRGRE